MKSEVSAHCRVPCERSGGHAPPLAHDGLRATALSPTRASRATRASDEQARSERRGRRERRVRSGAVAPPPSARRRPARGQRAPSTDKGEARGEAAREGAHQTWTIAQGGTPTTWTFGYDGSKELTSAKKTDGTTLLESNTYAYDNAGNRIQVGDGTNAPKNYDVNNLNQLLSERDHGKTTFSGYVDEPATVKVNGLSAKVISTDGGAPYKFEGVVNLDAGANTVVVEAKDGNNNTATKTYAVTTTGNAKTFEYDANGNLRFEKQPNGTVIREYRWDQQNRLVRYLQGTHESVSSYDGESKRIRIKELTSSVETKNEAFVWCGSRICQKRNSGGVVRNYFKEGFEEASGPTDYFYARDHLGSVREAVGSNGTTIASRLVYDPCLPKRRSSRPQVDDRGQHRRRDPAARS